MMKGEFVNSKAGIMRSFWAKSLGAPPHFTLEARIFNAICLASIAGLFLNIFLNFLLGIPQLGVLMLVLLAVSGLCYYFSRFKKRLNTAIIVYMIGSNVLFIINFKYNSGINGPSLLIFMLLFFLTISIVPKKQYWLWITINIAIVTTLLMFEYKNPAAIPNTYINIERHFIDLAYTYIFTVFFIFMVTTAVRKNYHAERKLVEQKAVELEQVNETKNKLFSILAHDLRSPLASVQNYLEVLSEFKLDDDERRSMERELLNSTQNTQQMLANLLSWSKSQMEGVTVKLVELNLKEVLQGTLQINQAIAAEKGIQLTDQLTDSAFIIADPDMLQLIVRNLVNNAIKFTNPGGQIMVSSEIIGDDCQVRIKDTGIGIPHDQQNDIFSLKTSSTYGTKNEKGVGLGLVLCKEFAELQGGKIAFESAPGTGSTFYVSFKRLRGIGDSNAPAEGELVKKAGSE